MRSFLRFAVASASLLIAVPVFAAAAPGDKAAAQALFDDAIKAMNKGSYAEACPKLEESQRLDAAMGTGYQLARCYEAAGRIASAWAGYVQVADQARSLGQGSREKAARDRALALEPRLSYVTVVVDARPDGLLVTRGDAPVTTAVWGTRIPVDPGTYHVAASAHGRLPWSTDVTVADHGDAVTVHVPDLALAPVPTPMIPALAAGDVSPSKGHHVQKISGIVTLSAGVAGLAAGGILGLVAKGNYDSANDACPPAGCTAAGKQTTDSARALGDDATVVFFVGAAAAVTGVVLWATAPSEPRTSSFMADHLRVGAGSLYVLGEF